jgi:hypothetical protein
MNTNTAVALDDLPNLSNPPSRPKRRLGSASAASHLVSARSLGHLSDDDLLASTRRLVGRSNQLFALLLAHLAEVEARGLHRVRACCSLYTYCIYELRFSEDAAFRRVSAARLVKRFPALLDSIERGELHLTGLLMLGPHLTVTNLQQVLALAKYRTKREIAKLVRLLDPLPDVPARIEPLGPAPARCVTANPSWEQFVQSMNTVRELAPGDGPRDWADGAPLDDLGNETDDAACDAVDREAIHQRAATALARDTPVSVEATAARNAPVSAAHADSPDGVSPASSAPAPATPARNAPDGVSPASSAPAPATPALDTPHLAVTQRYQVQFTATEEYVNLVERAKALLSHIAPNVELAEVHLRAMRALVAELSKRRYAAKATAPANYDPRAANHGDRGPANGDARAANHGDRRRANDDGEQHPANDGGASPRGRAIPAAVKRAVFERDEGRCTYVEPGGGRRCPETHQLEFHHETAYAHGGRHSVSNITLRCTAHNALAAEADFGREYARERRDSSGHEPFERR